VAVVSVVGANRIRFLVALEVGFVVEMAVFWFDVVFAFDLGEP
jgi:hypothetical protein